MRTILVLVFLAIMGTVSYGQGTAVTRWRGGEVTINSSFYTKVALPSGRKDIVIINRGTGGDTVSVAITYADTVRNYGTINGSGMVYPFEPFSIGYTNVDTLRLKSSASSTKVTINLFFR